MAIPPESSATNKLWITWWSILYRKLGYRVFIENTPEHGWRFLFPWSKGQDNL